MGVDISVVIIVRNGSAVIGNQLAALATQSTQVSWEVVVADNGSSDGTVAKVLDIAKTFPVSLSVADASGRVGVAHARNVGASAARGKVLAFCDSDDIVNSGWVQAAHDALADFELVGGDVQVIGMIPEPNIEPSIHQGYVDASFGGAVHGCNFGVRRDTFFDVGGFDEAMPPYGCDDTEFSYRVNASGHSVGRAPKMIVGFTPTVDVRTLLRKGYFSGQAEAIVWLLHEDYYGANLRITNLIKEFIRIPFQILGVFGPKITKRAAARQLVRRAGNLAGYFKHVRLRAKIRPEHVYEPLNISFFER